MIFCGSTKPQTHTTWSCRSYGTVSLSLEEVNQERCRAHEMVDQSHSAPRLSCKFIYRISATIGRTHTHTCACLGSGVSRYNASIFGFAFRWICSILFVCHDDDHCSWRIRRSATSRIYEMLLSTCLDKLILKLQTSAV